MSEWSFNKGEWTEAYVFLRLLGQGRMYGATKELVKDENVYIDICEILRNEKDKILTFKRFVENKISKVSVLAQDCQLKVVTSSEFDEMGKFLYTELISKRGIKGSNFCFPEVKSFLQSLSITSPKPVLTPELKEQYGAKTDIIIKYIDSIDHSESIQGFSIKSYLGQSPTLFNYSLASRLIYEVAGCTEEMMYCLNSIPSQKGIFDKIKEDSSLSLNFVKGGTPTFEDNMSYCDSRMMEVLDAMMQIKIGYIGNLQSSSCEDFVHELISLNPLNVRIPEVFYEIVVKRLLFNSFSGLTSSTRWNGRKMLTGGYIDVNRKGDILYYRAISDDVFESFLFKNTSIDTPERGAVRKIYHQCALMYSEGKSMDDIATYYKSEMNRPNKKKKGDWGYIYREDGRFYIAINFQIRFK